MPTSPSHPDPAVCDATAIRFFAVVGQFDLLVEALGAPVRVPRQVFDPEDQVDTPGTLVSEIGNSERYFRNRSSRDPAATEKWGRLTLLRQRGDVEVLDLTDEEDAAYTDLTSRAFTRTQGMAGPLGRGESAVIAIAESRGYRAVIDDGPARRVLDERSPGHKIMTSRDVLRAAAFDQLIDSTAAELIYDDILAEGYRGPDTVW